MTTESSSRGTRHTALHDDHTAHSAGAVGLIMFAGILMILAGAFHFVQGLVALANDAFYVVGAEYVFEFDVTAWGWIHVAAGVVVALAGLALLQGAMWARVVAVLIASVSLLANFLWMPYYPIWSLTVIAFDLLVIWAVVTHGREGART